MKKLFVPLKDHFWSSLVENNYFSQEISKYSSILMLKLHRLPFFECNHKRGFGKKYLKYRTQLPTRFEGTILKTFNKTKSF